MHYAEEYPDELHLVEYYGAVDTTWIVYGTRKRFAGHVIGQRVPSLFAVEQQARRKGVTPLPAHR